MGSKRQWFEEKGSALLIVLTLTFLFSAIVIGATTVVTIETTVTGRYKDGIEALYVAEAGVAVVLAELRTLPDWTPVLGGALSSSASQGMFSGSPSVAGGTVFLCCGARLTVVASGVPAGWGEPIYDRLDADIAKVMMGINAVKGVEIGAGFRSIEQKGTEHSDEMTPEGFLSNNAGGILGGISTGQDITVSIAIKPTSSIRLPRKTIDVEGNAATIETHGRHDPCVGIRATPIAEAFLALVLIDHGLRQRAQNGDVVEHVRQIPAQAARAGAATGVALEDPDPLEA